MFKKGKFLIIFIVMIVVSITMIGLGIILILLNKDITNKGSNSGIGKANSANPSNIINGIEYIDSTRNFKDVDYDNFSFLINKDGKKYLSFKQKDDEDKVIKMSVIYNSGDCFGTTFSYWGGDYAIVNPLNIIVSDDHFVTYEGIDLFKNKKLLWDKGDMKCYIAKDDNNFYNYQCITKIDGVTVGFYSATESKDDKSVTNAFKDFKKYLSVDKNLGFYLDHYLSYAMDKGVSLKSYKYIKVWKSETSDIIKLGDYDIEFDENTWFRDYSINSDNIEYLALDNYKIGYYISKHNFEGLIMYIYNEEGKIMQKAHLPYFNEYNIEPKDLLDLYYQSLVFYEKEN